jgi:hypothetical protein
MHFFVSPMASLCSIVFVAVKSRQIGLEKIWGLFYDHNFRRFLPIFGEKISAFLKNQCYGQFRQKLAVVWVKKSNIFAKFLGENTFKIITSVPVLEEFHCAVRRLLWWLVVHYHSCVVLRNRGKVTPTQLSAPKRVGCHPQNNKKLSAIESVRK